MRTVIIHGQSHKGSTYHIAHDIAEKTGGEIKEGDFLEKMLKDFLSQLNLLLLNK